jgi:hypothetical protein
MMYLSLTITAWLAAVFALMRPVRIRVWNYLGAVDVAVMMCLVLPWMIVPWHARFRPQLLVTRYAWWISAIMALDVLFFTLSVLGPLGSGHPSLEALGSSFLGLAKGVLVPVTLVLLSIAGFRGERAIIVLLGFLCLAGEALYAVYPTTWWSG